MSAVPSDIVSLSSPEESVGDGGVCLCCWESRRLLGVVGAGVEALGAGGGVDAHGGLGLGGLGDGDELLEEGLEVAEGPLGGAVHGGGGGVVMDLHEEAVDAVGDAGAGNAGDELPVAAGSDAAALEGATRGLLEGVGDVGDDGALGVAHPDEVAGVDDEVAVADHGAALADHHVGVACPPDLVGRVAHDGGSAHLPLLDVDDLSGLCGRDDEVRLAAQEGRDLDDVGDLPDLLCLPGLVHVCDDRDAVGVLDLLEDAEALLDAGAAEGGGARPVGLVEGALEDVGDAEPARGAARAPSEGSQGKGGRGPRRLELPREDDWNEDDVRLERVIEERGDVAAWLHSRALTRRRQT